MHVRQLVISLLLLSAFLTSWNVIGLNRLHHGPIQIPSGVPGNCSVLVTGSAGFIGMHVALGIKQSGGNVIGIDTFTNYYNPEIKIRRAGELDRHNIQTLNISICDKDRVSKVLIENGITHIVHLAAQPGIGLSIKKPEEYLHTNVQCFASVLEAMKIANVQNIIYASSSSVYGSVQPPFKESQTPSPTNVYGASKLQGEILASVYHRLYSYNTIGLRFFTVYGPWMRPDMAVYKFASKIYMNETIEIKGPGMKRDFTYVGDVVTAVKSVFWYLEGKPKNEVFNIGRSDSFPIDDLPGLLNSHLHRDPLLVTYTSSALYNMRQTTADISKAEINLKFRAVVGIQEGIHHFMKWFRHNKDWCARAALQSAESS